MRQFLKKSAEIGIIKNSDLETAQQLEAKIVNGKGTRSAL